MGNKVFTQNQENALGLDSHISLTANAGSGKTSVLIERYLKIALEKNIDLSKIVAITFTDKAAAELYSKISLRIEEKIQESQPEDAARFLLLRRQLYSAKISTIHSFCKDVIKEFAVEADVDTDFIVADQTLNDELIATSFDEFKREFHSPDFPSQEKNDIRTLVRIFGSWANLQSVINKMIEERRKVLRLQNEIYSRSFSLIESFFNTKYLQDLNLILAPFLGDFIEGISEINSGNTIPLKRGKEPKVPKITSMLSQLRIASQNGNCLDVLRLMKDLLNEILTQKGEIRSDYKKEFEAGKEFTESDSILLSSYQDTINKIHSSSDDLSSHNYLAAVGLHLMTLFDRVFHKYETKKKTKGLLDFEDLLLKAEKVVSDDHVRETLKERFNYIMIDEYQDTNEIQYNIFLPLVNYLKDNNFFVVGDEKQSIYMFRDAELEVFRKTRENIQRETDNRGARELEESFRMSPSLALFTNHLFSNLMDNPIPEFNRVAYSNIVCARSDNEPGTIEIILADNMQKELNNPQVSEIRMIAKRLKQLKHSTDSLNYRDIALLCRKRKIFPVIEKVFTDENIPYSILGGEGFYQRQTVYDIYNYLSFLVNKDDVPLVGLLRSPFFNLSDSSILEISLTEPPDPPSSPVSLWKRLVHSADQSKTFDKIVKILSENIKLAETYDIPSLIRKIIEEGDFLSVIAARKNGNVEVQNLEKLIKDAEVFVSNGYRLLYDYTEFLRDAIETKTDEGLVSPGDDSDTVKILTIHMAKGMQYKAVFVINMDEVPQQTVTKAKSVAIAKNTGLLMKIPHSGNYSKDYVSPPILRTYDYIQKEKEIAESVRLFYVAVTRAENFLFLSGVISDKPFKKNSFFSFLCNGLNMPLIQPKIAVSGKLKKALVHDGKFVSFEEDMTVEIPVLKTVDYAEAEADPVPVIEKPVDIKVNSDKIIETPSEEIYSATKIATFLHCPLKYKLTYELGFSKFSHLSSNHELEKESVEYEYKSVDREEKEKKDEDKSVFTSFSLFKGSIIHAALQKNTPVEDVDSLIEVILRTETDFTRYNLIPLDRLRNKVRETLAAFYNSATYKNLQNYRDYKNEYEIFVRNSNYILYGIIDKVIFDGDSKLIVVDYKTDTLPNTDKSSILQRGRQYSDQLMFYAYLLNSIMPGRDIELNLLFINYPSIDIRQSVSLHSISSFGKLVEKSIAGIRAKSFPKNLDHCNSCLFSDNHGNCII